jgi:FlgD Ig-like domain
MPTSTNMYNRFSFHSLSIALIAFSALMLLPLNGFAADNKVVFVVPNISSVNAGDALIFAYVRDSLITSTSGSFIPEYMDDLQAHNQRNNQPWWDSVGASVVLWSSSSFSAYHISGIDVPVLLFNSNALSNFNLGTKLNAVATNTWLNQHNHWITAPAPGDTLFSIFNANLTVGQASGANGGDLQSLVLSKESPGSNVACMVAVDSGALLQDGVTPAPNRRLYSGFTNANLWTWSHGWDLLFTRSFYWLLADTTNPIVYNRVRVTDHLMENTWFEIGSCNMATLSDGDDIRTGFDSGQEPSSLIRYDSLGGYIGAAPPGLKVVIDSVNFSMHLRPFSAYNIQGADSSFDLRIYTARIRRQVKFNQGSSNYNGTSCGVGDTAATTNQWANRFTPAYPSLSRHLWPSNYGDLVTDSAWKTEGAKDTTVDIFPWRPQDTLRENKTMTPPNSWTRFPLNPGWFQAWLDSPSVNYGFALQTDTLYSTSNIEMNHIGPVVLPGADDGPRLTIYWRYVTDIITDVDDDEGESGSTLPESFVVHQNFPNPFNPTTEISYSLPVKAEVTIEIYNVLGQQVRVFDQGKQSAGTHSVTWDATDDRGNSVASGMYFYKVSAGDFTASKKMMLLK